MGSHVQKVGSSFDVFSSVEERYLNGDTIKTEKAQNRFSSEVFLLQDPFYSFLTDRLDSFQDELDLLEIEFSKVKKQPSILQLSSKPTEILKDLLQVIDRRVTTLQSVLQSTYGLDAVDGFWNIQDHSDFDRFTIQFVEVLQRRLYQTIAAYLDLHYLEKAGAPLSSKLQAVDRCGKVVHQLYSFTTRFGLSHEMVDQFVENWTRSFVQKDQAKDDSDNVLLFEFAAQSYPSAVEVLAHAKKYSLKLKSLSEKIASRKLTDAEALGELYRFRSLHRLGLRKWTKQQGGVEFQEDLDEQLDDWGEKHWLRSGWTKMVDREDMRETLVSSAAQFATYSDYREVSGILNVRNGSAAGMRAIVFEMAAAALAIKISASGGLSALRANRLQSMKDPRSFYEPRAPILIGSSHQLTFPINRLESYQPYRLNIPISPSPQQFWTLSQSTTAVGELRLQEEKPSPIKPLRRELTHTHDKPSFDFGTTADYLAQEALRKQIAQADMDFGNIASALFSGSGFNTHDLQSPTNVNHPLYRLTGFLRNIESRTGATSSALQIAQSLASFGDKVDMNAIIERCNEIDKQLLAPSIQKELVREFDQLGDLISAEVRVAMLAQLTQSQTPISRRELFQSFPTIGTLGFSRSSLVPVTQIGSRQLISLFLATTGRTASMIPRIPMSSTTGALLAGAAVASPNEVSRRDALKTTSVGSAYGLSRLGWGTIARLFSRIGSIFK